MTDCGIACITFDDRPIDIDKDACPFNVAEIIAHNVNLSIPLCRQELTGIQILLQSLFPVAKIEQAPQRDSNEKRAQMHQKKTQ